MATQLDRQPSPSPSASASASTSNPTPASRYDSLSSSHASHFRISPHFHARRSSGSSVSSFDSNTTAFRSPLMALPSPALPLPSLSDPHPTLDFFSLPSSAATTLDSAARANRTFGFFSAASSTVLPPPRLAAKRPDAHRLTNIFDSPDSSSTPSTSPPHLDDRHDLQLVDSDPCDLSIHLTGTQDNVSLVDQDDALQSTNLPHLNLEPVSRHPTLIVAPSNLSTPASSPSTIIFHPSSSDPSIDRDETENTLLDPTTNTLYHLTKTLGTGSFSKVIEARSSSTNSLVALKMIANSAVDANDRMKSSVGREIGVLQHIRHPLLVSLISAFETTDQRCTVLALEHVPGGELFDLVTRSHTHFTGPFINRVSNELCTALSWMHKLGLVHRDIKLENILLTRPLYTTTTDLPPSTIPLIKLTDFGLSRYIDLSNPLLTTRCGSEEYASPELILGKPYDGRRTDTWALGVVLYAILIGNLPFEGHTRRSMLVKIAKGSYTWPSTSIIIKDEGVKKLVDLMLIREPEKRLKLEQEEEDNQNNRFKVCNWFNDLGIGKRPLEGSEAARILAGESLPDP